MFVVYDIMIVYKNGASVTVDNILKFNIALGDNWSCDWVSAPWSKTVPIIINVPEVQSVYKIKRRIWNPIKFFLFLKYNKENK